MIVYTNPQCPHCDSENLAIASRVLFIESIAGWTRKGTKWIPKPGEWSEIDAKAPMTKHPSESYCCLTCNRLLAEADLVDHHEAEDDA
jgi:hypothetical protein